MQHTLGGNMSIGDGQTTVVGVNSRSSGEDEEVLCSGICPCSRIGVATRPMRDVARIMGASPSAADRSNSVSRRRRYSLNCMTKDELAVWANGPRRKDTLPFNVPDEERNTYWVQMHKTEKLPLSS
ncbi:hypothetical protein [Burkholderia pseudomallei]|uniref:hypothetical protein n=2 Tax=Burkholderia TaxID=32008 RepID=UPI002933C462|nr:hypothetical protein [Burkholderia pseudomallei]MDV2108609.1 hypothetical protein [Burkholderia pseudomallei]MDV2177253.1 hypothetical protein [Burkholderia pseudomallei]